MDLFNEGRYAHLSPSAGSGMSPKDRDAIRMQIGVNNDPTKTARLYGRVDEGTRFIPGIDAEAYDGGIV